MPKRTGYPARAIAAAGLLFFAAASSASATVQNIGGFSQDNMKTLCGAVPATNCVIDFSPIASTNFLQVTQVSCRIITNPQAKFSTLQLGARPAEGHVIFTSYLTPQLLSALPSTTIYNLNHQVLLTCSKITILE